MTDRTTGAMQEFGSAGAAGRPGAGAVPGLVLLYAYGHERLPPAWPLRSRRIIIGRDDAADLPLPVNAVSRRHAELSWQPEGWLLTDLKSKNGTLLDGRRIEQARLEPTQEVRLGDAILKFVTHDADQYARYRPDGDMSAGAERLARSPGALLGGFQMDHILAELERVAGTSLNVLVLGESGTGKEVVARELHRIAGRRGRFCAINCAAIPANLIESELFGYKRGAFSGADRDKRGLVSTAHNGTLLLDEIGDMPLEAQSKLLRVLQTKEVFPLGSTEPEPVDLHVVCATHRDLMALQKAAGFRQDLYARLNEYELSLPPLRGRKEDIFLLVRAFLERHGRPELTPSFAFMAALLQYDWPYNVRELENCVKRCAALSETQVLDESLLPDAVRDAMEGYGQPAAQPVVSAPPPADGSPDPARIPTHSQLCALLEEHHGNVAAVSRELGKARMQIHRWMKRYGIQVDEFRS
jgi:DNA-binding NtrC family response regulator